MVFYAGYVISPLLENCFFVIHIIYACITCKKTNKEEIPLTLSLPECLMEFCKVTLTFESVDRNPWCDHSNESSLPVLTHGAMVKFGNSVEICFWRNLGVKGLRTPLCKLIIWFEEDLPGPLFIGQRCMKSYRLPRQLDGTFLSLTSLRGLFISLYITGAAIEW